MAENTNRPWIVCIYLVLFLRLSGKRELTYLNPFKHNVLLSSVNTFRKATSADGWMAREDLIRGLPLLAAKSLPAGVLYLAPRGNASLVEAPNLPGFSVPRAMGVSFPACNRSFYVSGNSISLNESQRTKLAEGLLQRTAKLQAACCDRSL